MDLRRLADMVRASGVPVPGDQVRIHAPESDLHGLQAQVIRTCPSALLVRLLDGPDVGETAAVLFDEAEPVARAEVAA